MIPVGINGIKNPKLFELSLGWVELGLELGGRGLSLSWFFLFFQEVYSRLIWFLLKVETAFRGLRKFFIALKTLQVQLAGIWAGNFDFLLMPVFCISHYCTSKEIKCNHIKFHITKLRLKKPETQCMLPSFCHWTRGILRNIL